MIFEGTIPNLSREKVVVVVWRMKGCPHCDEFVPRFKKIAAKYQHCLPILILDAEAQKLDGVANHFNVNAVPVVLVLFRGSQLRAEGSIDNWYIEHLLWQAVRGLSCPI